MELETGYSIKEATIEGKDGFRQQVDKTQRARRIRKEERKGFLLQTFAFFFAPFAFCLLRPKADTAISSNLGC